ncbi:MAG: hypothetical protein LBI01_00725 [Elusimicrobium sp.]|jgi:hypothetical protein|nr:hypothetical protein [Elusimicrobium sp.]
MKKFSVLLLSAFAVCACSSSQDKQTTQAKKLYIEDGEYQTASKPSLQSERRAAPPIIESDYIFRIQPRDTFYFDEQDMPIDAPPAAKAAAGKTTPGPMKRPKRYMGGSGYQTADASSAPAQTDDSSYSDGE